MADQTSPFLSLPEDWMSKIISLTSPKDACTAAAVSSALKFAADSDAVWERFLPPDRGEILSAPDSPVAFSTKKELYFLLCDSHLLLGGGKMSLQLNRSNGRKTCMLSARELEIAWVDNPSHWRWTSLPESRFAEVAELLSVCWLDIRATLRLQILTPNTTYAVYLVFKLSEDHYGLYGPSVGSLTFRTPAQTEGETTITNNVHIAPLTYPRIQARHRLPSLARFGGGRGRAALRRPDGWLEVRLGEFLVKGRDECDVRIQICETENRKKGLIVEGIEFRPLPIPKILFRSPLPPAADI